MKNKHYTFSHIVARSSNNAIGKNGQIPWHITEDLQFFKRMTTNKICIVGSKTYDGIKHLKNRLFVVVTNNPEKYVQSENPFAKFVVGVDQAITESMILADFLNYKYNEIFIIGGSSIYESTQKYINKAYVTEVFLEIEDADSFYDIDLSNFKKGYISEYDTHITCCYEFKEQ